MVIWQEEVGGVNFEKEILVSQQRRLFGFDSKGDVLCSIQNNEAMCDKVYKAMIESGAASKFDKEHFLDSDGNIVEKEEDAFGRKNKYLLTWPEYVFFVDEVGD